MVPCDEARAGEIPGLLIEMALTCEGQLRLPAAADVSCLGGRVSPRTLGEKRFEVVGVLGVLGSAVSASQVLPGGSCHGFKGL